MAARRNRTIAFVAMAIASITLITGSTLRVMAAGEREDPVPTCPKGQIWDASRKQCVSQKSSRLPDSDKLRYAFALAKAARYDESLEVLDTLRQPDTAVALNYRGYATRKRGWTQSGIKYYLRSVAMDPKYPRVREYLGEAYITLGKLDLARGQLDALRGICGTDCEEYRELSTAIDKAS